MTSAPFGSVSSLSHRPLARHIGAATAALLLSACAQLPGQVPGAAGSAGAAGAARPGTAASAPGAAAASAGPAVPGQPAPFATVTKDARRIDGLIPVWQKDDKFWLELAEADFGAPFFLSPKIAGGIGEGRLVGGLMMGSGSWVELRRVHNQVQLIERNAEYVARAGTPEARAVEASYSPSLLGSAPLASAPHPERKTVLVDAGALLGGDLLGLAGVLQRNYRQGYSLDGRNSAITQVRGKPELLVLELQQHFATASLAVPSPGAPPGAPVPSFPATVPDPRSLFIRLHYSLTRLPDQAMASRMADARIGHFTSSVSDFSDDLLRTPRVRHVNRWRLDKADPAALLSKPVKPITYWLDRNIPLKYRDAVRAGVLAWNPAFERAGFIDAIEVKQQPDDADFDTLDTGRASLRWMLNSPSGLAAIGPSHVDPRSGEILDADIGLEGSVLRFNRLLRDQILNAHASPADWAALLQVPASDRPVDDPLAPATATPVPRGLMLGFGGMRPSSLAERCDYAEQAAAQLTYGLDVLALRDDAGSVGPDGLPDDGQARTDAFIRSYLTGLVMHEVGHTLGLRHNFRASRVYGEAQLADPAWGRRHPLAGSVMDYAAINLPAPGAPVTEPFQTVLGPYDFWAIEYAYRPLAPADEALELGRIAARSGEPELAYGTDEDAYIGVDPEVLQFDLGSDPVAHVRKRIAIARDLLRRAEARTLGPTETYPRLRRSVGYALRDVAAATGVLLRQIGGLRTLRDAPDTGRDPLQPVPAAQQRAALDLIAQAVLSPQGLAVSPSLQRRLAPDFFDRADSFEHGTSNVATDFVPQQILAGLQRSVLAQLMGEGLAQRLIDNATKAGTPEESLRLEELYPRIARDVWAELDRAPTELAPLRRELQREHAGRLAAALLRPTGTGRADVRAMLRGQARSLLAAVERASTRRGWPSASSAHLQDVAETLREALQAKVMRTVG